MASQMTRSFKRPFFSPVPPTRRGQDTAECDEITSLPGLIRFNALHNPQHVFCYQAETCRRERDATTIGNSPYNTRPVTCAELDRAVHACSVWLRNALGLAVNPDGAVQPVALFLESDLGLFVHLAALLSINVPALLLSARLGAPSIRHLLQRTNTGTLLVSQRTRPAVSELAHGDVDVQVVESYKAFLHSVNGDSGAEDGVSRILVPDVEEDSCGAMILHSSGTTGLPKPIPVAHRYLLGYAACHQFGPDEKLDWINLSTLPLYHGFGLLAPSLSLSVGMSCCFPPSSIIPAAHSTLDLLWTVGAGSLMSVPSILQDVLSLPEKERTPALQVLSKLEFVAVGGGALSADSGSKLVDAGVKVLNHYGVTEIGAIAPIFCPSSDYNWRYIRLRSDLGLELRPVAGSKNFRLSGHPCGWDRRFEIQDEMELNPGCRSGEHTEVRVLGRVDDVIVLKTGEKVMPRTLEERLTAHEAVKTAVCVGNGRFEMAVLVEPSSDASSDPEELEDGLWSVIAEINESLDQHARVSSRKAIIIKPHGKEIPRTDKGSVMRREVAERFKQEIDAAYAAIELETTASGGRQLDLTDIEGSIRDMLASVAGAALKPAMLARDEDFFERGLDSLQSLRLARLIGSALRQLLGSDRELQLTAEFIYRHPTIELLAHAVGGLAKRDSITAERGVGPDRLSKMRSVAGEYTNGLRIARSSCPRASNVVLMTGSTGSLGAHVLARLAQTPSITKIVCLIRGSRASNSMSSDSSSFNGSRKVDVKLSALANYQRTALHTAGITSLDNDPKIWGKLQFIDADHFSIPTDEVSCPSDTTANDIAGQVTHILHLAWPMDFQRTLASFRPHLDLLQNLIQLAHKAGTVRPGVRVRLVFASSIAAVRHYGNADSNKPEAVTVPEEPLSDPSVALPMGYAEGKWVCERMLEAAGRVGRGVEPVVVRIGQLSGPEQGGGIWKTGEHIPVLVKACQGLGAWPDLKGTVSWLPVDNAAKSLAEILLHASGVPRFLHLENPIRQPASDLITIMSRQLKMTPNQAAGTLLPFDEWLKRAVDSDVMVPSLEAFFREHFRVLGQGKIVLDTHKTRWVSPSLCSQGGITKDTMEGYVRTWREEGYLE